MGDKLEHLRFLLDSVKQPERLGVCIDSAHALASDREKAMEVGCDGYLAKPCEPRAVVAEVQKFLGRDDAA